jgi:predicted acyltransferase
MSIDVLRGIAVLLMIFVNDAASIQQVSWRFKHAGSSDDFMTIADYCFPLFLFIVGASIPLSLQRVADQNYWLTAYQIFTRATSLLLMGLLMVNADSFGGNWRSGLWSFVMLSCLIVGWMDWPKGLAISDASQSLIRISAMIALAFLAAYYKSNRGEWLTIQWWGILGLIGWAYLVAVICYVLCGGRPAGLVAAAAMLFALYLADPSELLERIRDRAWLGSLGPYLQAGVKILLRVDSIVDFKTVIGPLGGCAVLGSILGKLILESRYCSATETCRNALYLAVGTFLAAVIFDAAFGINKVKATPAWVLYSVSFATLSWIMLWGIVDRGGYSTGFQWLADIGANPLFAFLMVPCLLAFFKVIGWNFWQKWGDQAWLHPLARPLAVTMIISALTALLSRAGWRVKL